MKTVIIISRCIKSKKNSTSTYIFHFKGVYMGLQVNSLELISQENLQRGDDYVMRVKVLSWEEGVLRGEILYCKNLDEITSH